MLDEQTESALAGLLRAGNHEAWTALYDMYSTPIWQYVARLVSARSAVTADIVQEVFLKAVNAIQQFEPDRGTLWNWLSAIAHRLVMDHWRKVALTDRLQARIEEGAIRGGRSLESDLSLTEICQNREFIEIVRFVMSELSPEYAGLLNAKYVDNQSLEEMSRSFGGSAEALKSKLARARSEFRAKFEALTGEANPLARS